MEEAFIKQGYIAGFKKSEVYEFASHVLAHPTRYREKTLDRAWNVMFGKSKGK
jgi:hypothetical protein